MQVSRDRRRLGVLAVLALAAAPAWAEPDAGTAAPDAGFAAAPSAPEEAAAQGAPDGGAAWKPPPPPLTSIPNGDRWLEHFEDDLLPFWNMPDAWGEPPGDFPTLRCNDGHRPDPAKPCPEIANAPGWIKENQGRDFVRMISRQTYFYGVAYHFTGDPKMLELARDGVRFIQAHALEPGGGAVTWLEKDKAGWKGGPPALERTSQDLAYAELGMAMYYYLTRDPAVLADVLKLKDYIFRTYWSGEWGMLKWVAKDAGHDSTQQQELVAQLDQVNGYMLLLAPIIPEPHRTRWKVDLMTLGHLLIDKYWSPEHHVFWGELREGKKLGGHHVDFGHTAKSLWMIDRIGQVTGDDTLTAFVNKEARAVLDRAFLPSGTWGARPRADGTIDPNKEWWIYAELDELAATLALRDASYAKYLATTYPYWLSKMVDHAHGEIWAKVSGADDQSVPGLKIHPWKNGYHTAEHALVSYLTTQTLQNHRVRIYFAFSKWHGDVRPYYFGARPTRVKAFDLLPKSFGGLKQVRLDFRDLQ
jgi:mannose/cellobiose epimerase-like protein (N-acyl-D-glucosamine 2-epimerase family)